MRGYLIEPMCTAASLLVLSALLIHPVHAQSESARPTPRLSNGWVSFEPPSGEKGVWGRGDHRALVPENFDEAPLRDRGNWDQADDTGLKPLFSEVPFQPWAESVYRQRLVQEAPPYTRCKPSGGFRKMAIPYGTDIVQVPEQNRIYIFYTGGAHSFRIIYLDGRPHPQDLEPSYAGHSVGHWEDDTLVIDTVGFNERGWIDVRGVPTTKQLHLTERLTRLDFDSLRYEITIDDPGAYTDPWSTGMIMSWIPGQESFQYLCQDGNLASELMVGEGRSSVDRSSVIVP